MSFHIGSLKVLTANNEIILSAGSVMTPTILLHSGIGDPELLEPLGIATILSLPSEGKNLTDHIGVSTAFIVNSTDTYDTVLRNETLLNEWIEEWTENKTGYSQTRRRTTPLGFVSRITRPCLRTIPILRRAP